MNEEWTCWIELSMDAVSTYAVRRWFAPTVDLFIWPKSVHCFVDCLHPSITWCRDSFCRRESVGWFYEGAWAHLWWLFQLTVLSLADSLNTFVHNDISLQRCLTHRLLCPFILSTFLSSFIVIHFFVMFSGRAGPTRPRWTVRGTRLSGEFL